MRVITALMAVSAVDADVAKDNSFDFLVFAQIWDVVFDISLSAACISIL